MQPRSVKSTVFRVVDWNTGEVYYEFKKLAIAKRYARGMGHTGEDNELLTGYPPIAFVANDKGELVYNPRFGKNISSAVGEIVNTNDDCLRG